MDIEPALVWFGHRSHQEKRNPMQYRATRIVLAIAGVLFGLYVLEPYVRVYVLSASAPRAVEPRGTLAEFEQTTIALFARVSPSVVQVVTLGEQTNSFGLSEGSNELRAEGTGTGFVWDAAGNVVTNAHVIGKARRVAIRTATGSFVAAEVIGSAPNYDIAVVRVTGRAAIPAPIPIGSSADLKVGQWVFAVGNPFGLDQTLTTGVISALKRRLPTAAGREISGVIQTDAAINPGNSGGPLLDSAGRVIGVNTAIISPSGTSAGIGFAIPIDVVNRVVPGLIGKGRVPTPGIGIIVGSEELAARAGVEGVIIIRTTPDSPAERAGLRGVDMASGVLGDVIVAVNDRAVRRLADLTEILEGLKLPTTVSLTVQRGSQRRTVTVEVVDIGN
jgi:2-alkenal reductase